MANDLNLTKLNEEFESKTAEDIMAWALERHGDRAGLSSSFGIQSVVLIHMATKINPRVPVVFIDTGFLFKETYQYAEEVSRLFNLNLRRIDPDPADVEEVRERLKNNAVRCCDDIKVKAMERALENLDCWITGVRRQQAETRKSLKFVEEPREGLIKVHPIASWTSKDVYEYMQKHNLPFHPLWERGYTSVGCEPCTRPPAAGGDERSGRWAGKDKTECGLHTYLESKD